MSNTTTTSSPLADAEKAPHPLDNVTGAPAYDPPPRWNASAYNPPYCGSQYRLKAPHHRAAEWFSNAYLGFDEGLSEELLRDGGKRREDQRPLHLSDIHDDPAVARRTHQAFASVGALTPLDADGTFMPDRFMSLSPLLYNPVHMQSIEASDVWDTATILEVTAAGLAAERITDKQLERLEQEVFWRHAEPGDYLDDGFAGFSVNLLEGMQSCLLHYIIILVVRLRTDGLWSLLNEALTNPDTGLVPEIEADRRQIVAALRARDPQAARAAMQTHMDRLRDHLFERVPPADAADTNQQHKGE
jgi:DNA-binding FadR family transcriptional regulator